ncbi:hypothetical protein [Nocardioides daeguensis]|uniref:Mce-associated membrane protein n=1 Tax=Nocardioides daeguensis TaxID=908359 RepID=A0ABP6WGA9_9ACTN|nr:hypothetical protein [Nocardioides daeguensis]MBV6727965.1 hypothetical protein [Nocardioides daeguensis]MCR1774039.1 hypothetical protein [Nocardioides daeguensis]
MSIRQPRRATAAPRRRPRVAGQAVGQAVGVRTADEPQPTQPTQPAQPSSTGDDAVPAEPAAGRARRRLQVPRRSWRWLAPLLAASLAGAAFGTVTTLERAERDAQVADQAAAQDAAAAAAAGAAEEILSYAHDTVAEDLEAAQERMTPAFAKDFAEVVPTVTSLAEQRQLVVTATVRDVAVVECGEECSTSTVRVLLFVDQERTGEGKPLDPIEVRTVLTMTRSGDGWLVSDSVSL